MRAKESPLHHDVADPRFNNEQETHRAEASSCSIHAPMAQMFASFNKNNTKGTLVGNWVEEEALRNTTGFSRRKVPEPVSAPGNTGIYQNLVQVPQF
jgi:hypothetical protein